MGPPKAPVPRPGMTCHNGAAVVGGSLEEFLRSVRWSYLVLSQGWGGCGGGGDTVGCSLHRWFCLRIRLFPTLLSVATQSYQWYSWGPPNMQCRLCASCWTYWKKYGGLKMPTRLDGERPGPNRNNMVSGTHHTHLPPAACQPQVLGLQSQCRIGAVCPIPQSPHGIPARSSGSPKFAMKTRQAFYLHTTKLTRIARRLCREILRPWHAARHPYMPINSAAIKAECESPLLSFLGSGRVPRWGQERARALGEHSSSPYLVITHQAQHGCPKLPRAHWC